MATDICYPVIKFSFATGVRHDGSVPWQHYQSDQLFVIVKGTDTQFPDGRLRPDGKLDLKVVDRTKVMESVNIARYVDDATDTRRRAREARIALKVEQLPMFGITQDSLLALRYKLGDGQARRFQLRLEDSARCKQIVSVFERRGMEFQERRPRTARPDTGRSTSTAVTDRPHTSHMQPTPPNSDHANQSRIPCADRSQGDLISTSRPGWLPQDVQVPADYTRDEPFAPKNDMPAAATTSQLIRTSTMQQRLDTELTKPIDVFNQKERPSSTSHLSTLERIRNAVEDDSASSSNPVAPTDGLQPSERVLAGSLGPHSGPMPSSDPAQILTSTTIVPPPETQEFELPPRRELPFKRPESKRSSTGREPDSNPPPLSKLKPTAGGAGIAGRSDVHSRTKDNAGRPSTASPLKRSFVAVDEHISGRPQTSIGLQSACTIPSSAGEYSLLNPSPTNAEASEKVKKPRRMDELPSILSSREPFGQRTTNTQNPRVNSLADAEHEVDSSYSPSKRQAVSVHDPVMSVYTAVEAAADTAATTLEEYATQSFQDRQTALEQFMISNLENPAFVKLCEDIENCWRRIALGL